MIRDPCYTSSRFLRADHPRLEAVAAAVTDRNEGGDVDSVLHVVKPCLTRPACKGSGKCKADGSRIAGLKHRIRIVVSVDDVVEVAVIVDRVVVGG
jgi:hypothetical protein